MPPLFFLGFSSPLSPLAALRFLTLLTFFLGAPALLLARPRLDPSASNSLRNLAAISWSVSSSRLAVEDDAMGTCRSCFTSALTSCFTFGLRSGSGSEDGGSTDLDGWECLGSLGDTGGAFAVSLSYSSAIYAP